MIRRQARPPARVRAVSDSSVCRRGALGLVGVLLLSGCSVVGDEVNTQSVRSEPLAVCELPSTSAPSASDATWPLSSMGLPSPLSASGNGVTVAIVDSGLVPGVVPVDRVLANSRSVVEGAALGDDGGHGTHMAELVHHIAPRADILAVKALDHNGRGRPATIADGVRSATASGADVILLSMETAAPDEGLRSALEESVAAGTLVVIAAGNDQLDLDRFARYPASFDLEGSLVVAASDARGTLTASTNWGASTVDLSAPGVDIPVTGVPGSGDMISGSSPAAALIAGAAALLLQDSDRDETITALRGTARQGSLDDAQSEGTRLVDVGAALDCLEAGTHTDPSR